MLPKTEPQIDALFGQPHAPKLLMTNPQHEADALVIEQPYFRNMQLEVPSMTAAQTPACVHAAVITSEQGGLMAPHERRSALDFQVKQQKAHALQKTAELQDRRRVQLMRARHPDGALGVDSTANTNSYVYGERAEAQQRKDEQRARHHNGRQELQANVSVAERRVGYNPFHHNEKLLPPKGQQSKFLQSKSGRNDAGDTHDRLFGEKMIPENPVRAQKLRDEDLSGKNYSIISGAAVQHAPSVAPERVHGKLAHMSQQSCERGRHTQGMVMPSHRMTSPFLDPRF